MHLRRDQELRQRGGRAARRREDRAGVAQGALLALETLRVVCFVVGTESDPQGLDAQERALRDAGAILAPSSSAAAALAETLVPTEVAA